MLAYPEKTTQICKSSERIRIEQERMRDVSLLLQHLVQKEEVTVKLILDCLYDIGSVNLIDQKFKTQSLNRLMKAIANMTKPIFRIFAFRWFKKNCPQMIADWLYQQVKFGDR
jgi:hypothetical protein